MLTEHISSVGGVMPQPFFVLQAISNVVTNGNGMGTKNVLKSNRAIWFEFSIQFSVFAALLL